MYVGHERKSTSAHQTAGFEARQRKSRDGARLSGARRAELRVTNKLVNLILSRRMRQPHSANARFCESRVDATTGSTIRIIAADVISGKAEFLRIRDALVTRGETARRFSDHVCLRIEPAPAPSLLIENNPRHAALLLKKNSSRSSNRQVQLCRPECSLSNVAKTDKGREALASTRSGRGWRLR
jgi:hypothetical protein